MLLLFHSLGLSLSIEWFINRAPTKMESLVNTLAISCTMRQSDQRKLLKQLMQEWQWGSSLKVQADKASKKQIQNIPY
jgi:hypothetical protein